MIWLIVQGMGFGLAIAAPVGPMSLLCMRRTLAQGWRPGLATGLGIATGDGLFACVAVLGLAGLSQFLLAQERPLHFIAGLFLLYLGLKTALSRPAAAMSVPPPVDVRRAYIGSVLLTLTNAPTIVIFAAIFTSMSPPEGFTPATAIAMVVGVTAGSMLWWAGLVTGVSGIRHAFGPRARRWIDRVAGAALAAFGAAELGRAL